VCWFARRPECVAKLADALARGEKMYVALAHGVTHERGRIKKPIGERGKLRDAVTRYRRRRVVTGHSLLELFPEHGRKHQLRRHLSAIGHGVLGDGRHGHAAANRHFAHRHGLDRTFLHCARLRVELDSGTVEMRAELAGDLAAVLASLERDGG
jgi:23S rRNA-/tRNA-specific pseudouridylate synthase